MAVGLVAEEVDMADYFGQYKGAAGGLLPSGIASEMGKAGQYLAGGMQQLGAGLGKGLEEYRKNKEKKEILTERAEWIADQKESELEQWLQGDPSKIDTPDGDQKVKEIQKFRDKIHSSSTSQLTSLVANEMLEYERQGKELDRQLKQSQIDAYDSKISQDDAAAAVYGDYRRGAGESVRETSTRNIPAEYRTEQYSVESPETFIGPAPQGVADPRFEEGSDPLLRNAIAEADYLNNPIYKETEAAERGMASLSMMKEDLVREFNEEVKDQNSSLKFIRRLPAAGSYEEVHRYLGGYDAVDQEGKPLERAWWEPGLGAGIKPIREKLSGMTDLIDNYAEGVYQKQTDLRSKLFDYMPNDGSGDLDKAARAYADDERLDAVTVPQAPGKPWMESREVEVSPARSEEVTVERPKTVGERRQLLEGLIEERAGDLGVAGIKSFKELAQTNAPQIQEIGGFKYAWSPKTGAMSLLPGQEQTAATPAQIKAMAAMGYKPKTATLKLGNGITMQMEVPPAEDGTKRTEGQAQAFLHSELMDESDGVIQNLEDSGQFNAEDLTESFELYHDVTLAKSPEAKQYADAMNKWIEGYLRYVSGAAIAEHEYKGARSQFFPVVGDSEENKAIKKTRRATTVRLLKEISGGGDVKKLVDHAASLPGGGINLVGRGAATPEEAEAEARAVGMKSGDSFKWYDKKTRKFYPITLN